MTEVEQLASLSPGEVWVGNRVADYALILAQDDPAKPRVQDADWQGRKCLAFWVYNEDRGPNANPPGDDKNPRAQAESSTFMKRGGHYLIDHYIYVKTGNLPTWSGGWFNFWEKYGKPYGGPPPLSFGSHDGQQWEWTRGEDPWDVLYQEPIGFDRWECVSFDFVNADPGPVTMYRNGVPVVQFDSFRVINDSDQDGNWMTVPHLYMERDGVVPDGQRVGPVWMYDVVRQLG
jgi:hypothetical protein